MFSLDMSQDISDPASSLSPYIFYFDSCSCKDSDAGLKQEDHFALQKTNYVGA